MSASDSVTAEITAPAREIDALTSVMRPYGIKELVRTGVIAMVRGWLSQILSTRVCIGSP